MTLLTALLVGIGTGLFIRDRRRRLWVTGLAVTVMLPIQSWGLPLVKKPHFSLSDPGYWGVQPFILLLGLLLTLGVGQLRNRGGRTTTMMPARRRSTPPPIDMTCISLTTALSSCIDGGMFVSDSHRVMSDFEVSDNLIDARASESAFLAPVRHQTSRCFRS